MEHITWQFVALILGVAGILSKLTFDLFSPRMHKSAKKKEEEEGVEFCHQGFRDCPLNDFRVTVKELYKQLEDLQLYKTHHESQAQAIHERLVEICKRLDRLENKFFG